MKKFFGEFKKFITRGNVLDMAVGVIVGGAFTAIVNGLSNFVLKPIINFLLALIMGKGSLENIVTFLGEPAYKLEADGVTKVIDLANSFYIDWGSLINAIINFLLIAFVLFSIVKAMNKLKENNEVLGNTLRKLHLNKEERAELKANGVNIRKRKDVKKYLEEKALKEQKEKEEAEKAEQEKLAQLEIEKAQNSTEALLKQIKELLEKNLENK